jgi:catechol 2,3-dioxygenase-like lactoylglutathione lyase family enzyme
MTARFRFDCFVYYVTDLDRAVDFYANVLGLPMSSRDTVARFEMAGTALELVATDDRSLLSGKGNARLTLVVEDIEAATADLLAQRVPVTDVREEEKGRVASLLDPDGNEIVLREEPASSMMGALREEET